MNDMYFDFGTALLKKVKNECNGNVSFGVFEPVDVIIIKVRFKDFVFNHAVGNVSQKIHEGVSVDEIFEEFRYDYLRTLQGSFFKSTERKHREKIKNECYI